MFGSIFLFCLCFHRYCQNMLLLSVCTHTHTHHWSNQWKIFQQTCVVRITAMQNDNTANMQILPVMTANMRSLLLITANMRNSPVMTTNLTTGTSGTNLALAITNMRISPLMAAYMRYSPVMTVNIQNFPVMTVTMWKWHTNKMN